MGPAESPFTRIVRRALEFYEYSLEPGEECPIFPDHVHIEPTNACNLRCVHCHHAVRGTHFTKKMGMMDLAVFRKAIDDIRGLSSRITLNQQGEPLLHPHILEMVSYAKGAGLSVSMLTNATRLTPETAETLLDLGLDRIVFSFEGTTAEIHERIRRNSRHAETLANILHFIGRNFERGRPTFICMSMVESSYSREDIVAYREYFGRLPVNTIFVNPLLTMSGASLTSGEIDMSPYQAIPPEKIPVCRLPWESVVVNWDGTVSPCAVDYNESHVIGNVRERSLPEIFNGPAMRRFRRCHLDREYGWIEAQGPLCVSCNCRFNDEYDLRNLKEFATQYIVRQAKVFAPQLLDADVSDVARDEEAKYGFLLEEKRRLGELLGRAER